jgi:RNA polymerase sigma-70 factor, ECF subfamily
MSDRRAEFAERLRGHHAALFGYIVSLVRDFDDADDLFQATSLALWKKYETYDPDRPFLAWACGVARYEVANFLRARGRRKLYFSDDLNLLLVEAQEELEREKDREEDRRVALSGCLEKLRRRDRALLDACYGPEGRVADVAAAWRRSSQSVHNSLRRIRRSLEECVRRGLARELA